MVAAELAEAAAERFLRYVRIDTQSDPDSDDLPVDREAARPARGCCATSSRPRARDVELDEHGYVFATVPGDGRRATCRRSACSRTSTRAPTCPATGVEPQRARATRAARSRCGAAQVLGRRTPPSSREHVGHDMITTDGDDAARRRRQGGRRRDHGRRRVPARAPRDPARPAAHRLQRPTRRSAHGTDHFDLERFGAARAYTLDGSTAGEIQDETFSADRGRSSRSAASTSTPAREGRARQRGQARGAVRRRGCRGRAVARRRPRAARASSTRT